MDKEIFLYVNSKDSLSFHPENNPSDFTVELPEIINFNSCWVICLTEIYIRDDLTYPINIFCDICEQSIQDGELKSILKVIYPDCIQFSNLHYIPIKVSSVSRIRFSIKGGSTGKESVLSNPVQMSLHLYRKNE